jgi:hypothetical protein
MKSRQAPYDDFIMDHIRNARNYRALDLVSREATASNLEVMLDDEKA